MSAFDHEAIRAHVEMRHKLAVAAEMDGVLTVTIIELNLTGGTTVMASDGAAASATCSPGLAGFAERSLGLFPTAKQAANTILIREGEA